MAVWPATLPQRLRLTGNAFQAKDGSIRTQMDAGPEFTRPRFTAVPINLTGSIVINTTQYNTLESFWKSTLIVGAAAFDWVHPISGAAVQMRFLAPPDYTVLSGDQIQAALSLEMLP